MLVTKNYLNCEAVRANQLKTNPATNREDEEEDRLLQILNQLALIRVDQDAHEDTKSATTEVAKPALVHEEFTEEQPVQ